MAPEQALGQAVDARADLYALGVMTFEMIAGARPYEHESKVTLLGMHVTAPIPKMADRAPAANVPPEVDAIVTKLLAKEATARFAESKDLVEALDVTGHQLAAAGRIAEPLQPMSRGMARDAGLAPLDAVARERRARAESDEHRDPRGGHGHARAARVSRGGVAQSGAQVGAPVDDSAPRDHRGCGPRRVAPPARRDVVLVARRGGDRRPGREQQRSRSSAAPPGSEDRRRRGGGAEQDRQGRLRHGHRRADGGREGRPGSRRRAPAARARVHGRPQQPRGDARGGPVARGGRKRQRRSQAARGRAQRRALQGLAGRRVRAARVEDGRARDRHPLRHRVRGVRQAIPAGRDARPPLARRRRRPQPRQSGARACSSTFARPRRATRSAHSSTEPATTGTRGCWSSSSRISPREVAAS